MAVVGTAPTIRRAQPARRRRAATGGSPESRAERCQRRTAGMISQEEGVEGGGGPDRFAAAGSRVVGRTRWECAAHDRCVGNGLCGRRDQQGGARQGCGGPGGLGHVCGRGESLPTGGISRAPGRRGRQACRLAGLDDHRRRSPCSEGRRRVVRPALAASRTGSRRAPLPHLHSNDPVELGVGEAEFRRVILKGGRRP